MTERLACVVTLFASLACSNKADSPAEKPAKAAPPPVKTQPSVGDRPPAGADPFGAELGAELAAITPGPVRDSYAVWDNIVDPHTSAKGLSVYYTPSIVDAHEQLKKVLEKHRVIEHALDVFRTAVEAPVTLEIRLATCGAADLQYHAGKQQATICYELIEQALASFKPHAKSPEELGTAVAGATFGYLHDALAHVYGGFDADEPARQLRMHAVYLGAGEPGAAIILSGAYWLAAQRALGPELEWYDKQHEGNLAAYETAICAVYGASPTKRAALATQRGVTKTPAACAAVYATASAGMKELAHLLTDRALRIYQLERPKQVDVDLDCKSTAGWMVLMLSDSKSSSYWKEQQEIFTKNCEEQGWSQDVRKCAFDARDKAALMACGLEIKPH